MSERATINQVVQIGVEATPGTAVAASKLLQALNIEPAIKIEAPTFRPLGGKFPVLAAPGKDYVQAKISGDAACYNHLAYLLAGVLAYAAPAQQGTTPAYKWTFSPSQTAEDTIKTYTVEQGSSARAGRFAYGLVTEFGLRFDRRTVEVSGSMLGQAYEDGIAMTAAPTAVQVQPIVPSTLDVYLDDTAAGIGVTKLTRLLSGEFKVSDRFGPLWTVNSALSSFAAHVETKPKMSLTLLVEADAAGMGLLAPLRSGDKRYVRLKAVGPLIAGTYYYSFQLDLCCVVTEVGEFSDEDGVYAVEWTLTPAYDADWGKAVTCELVNTLSGL